MRKFLAAAVVALAAFNTHAASNMTLELCASPLAVQALNGECPPVLTNGLVTPGQTDATVTTLTSTVVPDTVHFLLHDNSDPFTNSVEDRDRLISAPNTQTSTTLDNTTDIIADSTANYLSFVAETDGYEGNIITLGPFDAVAGGVKYMNWNPGVYLSNNVSNYRVAGEPLTGAYKTAANYYANSSSRDLCFVGNEWIKGELFRIELGEMYPEGSNGVPHPELVRFMDEVVAYLSDGSCAGKRRSFSILVDAAAVNRDADEGLCAPHELVDFSGPNVRGNPTPVTNQFVYMFENNGGRRRCQFRIWNEPVAKDRLIEAITFWAKRYEGLGLEMISPKGEGAWLNAAQLNAANFDPNTAYQTLLDIGADLRAAAPETMVCLGTNNFVSGENERIYTQYKPVVEGNEGYCFRWPDTFAPDAPGSRGNVLTTNHGAYYHMFHGQIGLWGDWQIPGAVSGGRFSTYQDVVNNCCVAGHVPTDPTADDSEFRNPADGTLGFTPAERIYGSTHVTLRTVFGGTNGGFPMPVSDLTDLINAPPYNGVFPLLDASCPDVWTAQGYTCRDVDGNVVP